MARPRRAKNHPGRVLIPLVVLLGIAAGLVAWRTNLSFDVAGLLRPGAASTGPVPSTPPSSPADGSAQVSRATEALRTCRQRVDAGDALLEAADTGIEHWSQHVQAQTKADRSRISVTMLDRVFQKTREAGPADRRQYDRARKAYQAVDGSCASVRGAPAELAADLTSCSTRVKAQERLLRAAEPAMADWKAHLAKMERSAKDPQPDDQAVWLRDWRAAPPHLDAYAEAVQKFEDDAPRCPG